MGDYSKDKDYSVLIQQNLLRKDYNCPCCNKSFPLDYSEFEEFELTREYQFFPSRGFIVRNCAYRICPKCYKKREKSFIYTFKFPVVFSIAYLILGVLISIIIFIIRFSRYMYIGGLWWFLGTPLLLLIWILPSIIWHKYSSKLDFDKCLKRNAVNWNYSTYRFIKNP